MPDNYKHSAPRPYHKQSATGTMLLQLKLESPPPAYWGFPTGFSEIKCACKVFALCGLRRNDAATNPSSSSLGFTHYSQVDLLSVRYKFVIFGAEKSTAHQISKIKNTGPEQSIQSVEPVTDPRARLVVPEGLRTNPTAASR